MFKSLKKISKQSRVPDMSLGTHIPENIDSLQALIGRKLCGIITHNTARSVILSLIIDDGGDVHFIGLLDTCSDSACSPDIHPNVYVNGLSKPHAYTEIFGKTVNSIELSVEYPKEVQYGPFNDEGRYNLIITLEGNVKYTASFRSAHGDKLFMPSLWIDWGSAPMEFLRTVQLSVLEEENV